MRVRHIICDICNEEMKYSLFYNTRYRLIMIGFPLVSYNRLDICNSCIEKIKELRKKELRKKE